MQRESGFLKVLNLHSLIRKRSNSTIILNLTTTISDMSSHQMRKPWVLYDVGGVSTGLNLLQVKEIPLLQGVPAAIASQILQTA